MQVIFRMLLAFPAPHCKNISDSGNGMTGMSLSRHWANGLIHHMKGKAGSGDVEKYRIVTC
jgi:hypothetical protein